MVNTPTPTPEDLPEIDRAKDRLWREHLEWGSVTRNVGDQREQIQNILGLSRKEAGKLRPDVMNLEAEKNIFSQIGVTRRALAPYLTIGKHWNTSRNVAPGKKIEDIVSDPNSKEAEAILWLFNSTKDKRLIADYLGFSKQLTPSDIQNISSLQLVKKKYNEIRNEPAYLGIGDPANGKIGKISNKISDIDKLISGGSVSPDQLINLQARKDVLEEKIDTLESKKSELKGRLTSLNSEVQSAGFSGISTPIKNFSDADIDTIATDFQPNSLKDWSTRVKIAGQSHTINEWITQDNKRESLDELAIQARSNSTHLPRSSNVLNKMMERYFASDMALMNDQNEKDRFLNEMKEFLVYGKAPEAEAAPPSNSDNSGNTGGGGGDAGAPDVPSSGGSGTPPTGGGSKPWYGYRWWNPASYVTAPVAATGNGIWKNKKGIGATAAGVAGAAVFGLTGPVGLAAGGAIGLGMYYANKNKAS